MAFIHGLRLVVRQLAHARAYALMVVLTLAMAVGANSAVFSTIQAVLLRPFPVIDPDHLVVAWQTDNRDGKAVIELTHRHLREWTSTGQLFSSASIMGSHQWDAILEGRGEPVRLHFTGVSAAFFDTLGARPWLGRAFRPDDDVPNARPVAVLNHAAWMRRFGGDPAIVGRTITLDGGPVEIVGVMPPGLDFPRGTDFWAPAVPLLVGGPNPNSAVLDGVGVFYLLARLRPGISAAGAARQIDLLDARLQRDVPGRPKWGDRAVVVPVLQYVFGPVRPALWLLWCAVGVLLLVACANVSGLLLTRVSARRREHGVRLALGATVGRVARLWFAEILVLGLAGGLLGLWAAHWLGRAIATLAPDDLPGLDQVAVNAPVAALTLATAVIASLAVSALPIGYLGSVGLTDALASGDRTSTGRQVRRFRSGLLIGQIALAIVLLIGAGLTVRSVANLRRLDLGFEPGGVLSVTVQPRGSARPGNEWMDDLLARVRRMPTIEAAGAVYLRPLMLGPIGDGIRVRLEGQPATGAGDRNPMLNYQIATVGYFETLRIRLVDGRLFTPTDNATSPRVAIVSASTARRLWPGQRALGQRVLMSSYRPAGERTAWRTVVGVVADVRYRGLDEVQLDIYDPALQVARTATNLVVRTTGAPLAAVGAIQAQARQLDPAVVVEDVAPLAAVVDRAMAPWRLTMWMFALFAAVAFGLALVGIVSVVALDVSARRREFAIRLALGATRAAVLRSVLGRTAWRVAAGVALGMSAAAGATRVMRSVLFGVPALDPVTYGAVLVGVVALAALAAYLPGRRATRTEVSALLRD
jgi:putative ABC transport system permease protein